MQTTRGLYIFVLASLLILTGCFGTGVIEDTEGQAEDNENNEQSTEGGGSENIPPLITVYTLGEIESPSSDPAGDFDVRILLPRRQHCKQSKLTLTELNLMITWHKM